MEGWKDGKKGCCAKSKKLPPRPFQRSIIPSVHHCSPTNRTAYPAWVRLTVGEPPPGHITISPPSATIMPPYHTHQTSGLIVKRNTPCSVPFTSPASTTSKSSRRSLRMSTSVEGWHVRRPG